MTHPGKISKKKISRNILKISKKYIKYSSPQSGNKSDSCGQKQHLARSLKALQHRYTETCKACAEGSQGSVS